MPKTKQCQNCKQNFQIEEVDFEFYNKIKVPPPTFCPECRMQRRLAFRNERSLHKRQCDLCGKEMITIYQEGVPFPVYCMKCWWSDTWEPLQFAKKFDASRPFFEQFKKLQDSVPRAQYINYAHTPMVNSDYTNCAGAVENCYLTFASGWDRNCAYSHYINNSNDCFDILYGLKNERCYECFDIEDCYNLRFSQSCLHCIDSMFLYDCRNCTNCIGCVGLRNKNYHIFNKPYSKEAFEKKKKELRLDSRDGITALRETYLTELYSRFPRKYYHGHMNKDFTGDYLANVEKTHQSFYTENTRNVKFSFWCINGNDVYDYFAWGDLENSYECVSCGDSSYGCRFVHTSWSQNRDLEYCNLCFNSSDLFGCIGLRHKQYCILNTQYSKDEYEKLRKEIIAQMAELPYTSRGGQEYKYGEFFPPELSPFFYNDTIAQELFPLTTEKARNAGYPWGEAVKKSYQATLSFDKLPSIINEVSDSILQEIISCEHQGKCEEQCTGAFRIIPQELAFYRQINVPLPRLCPNCRHYQRIKQRNPLKLWHRQCTCGGDTSDNGVYKNTASHFHGAQHCPNEFETSYAPERPEIVYCEQCYQSEVV